MCHFRSMRCVNQVTGVAGSSVTKYAGCYWLWEDVWPKTIACVHIVCLVLQECKSVKWWQSSILHSSLYIPHPCSSCLLDCQCLSPSSISWPYASRGIYCRYHTQVYILQVFVHVTLTKCGTITSQYVPWKLRYLDSFFLFSDHLCLPSPCFLLTSQS